jgi:exosortase A
MRHSLNAATNDVARLRIALQALLLTLLVVLLAYRDTAAGMVSIWIHSNTFAHAFLVLPIVLWLIWRRRHDLARIEPRPCPWMLLPMAAIAFAWLLGDLVSVNSVTEFAFTALVVLSVPAVLGIAFARVILFPLAFTFFAVPIGEFLLPQLMSWTADFTVVALRTTGIPVFREGNQLVIPSGRWSVVEACSGVRYLIASFMVGTLYGYLHYRSAKRRWVFATLAIVVPVIANWLRAYFIVLLGHLSNNTVAVGVDHLIYGWLFFGLVMGLLYAVGTLWSEGPAASAVRDSRPGLPRLAWNPRSDAIWSAALATIAIAVAPHLVLTSIGNVSIGATPRLAALEDAAGGWRSDEVAADWKPVFRNPSAEATHFYVLDGRRVGVYVAYYRQQNYQRKLVSSDNSLVRSEDPDWLQVSKPSRFALENDGKIATFQEALLRRTATREAPEQRLRVWQVYWVAGTLTSSDYWAKLLAAKDRLLGRDDDSAVIVFYASEDQAGGGEAALRSFVAANLGNVVAQLQAIHAGAGSAGVAANSPSSILER